MGQGQREGKRSCLLLYPIRSRAIFVRSSSSYDRILVSNWVEGAEIRQIVPVCVEDFF